MSEPNGQRDLTQDDIDALWHPSGPDYATVAQRGVTACRAALTQARTRNCPHGVAWRNCHQHNGDEETK